MQSYHSNAKTNIHIREQIQNDSESTNEQLAEKHNISAQTVSKWRNSEFLEDTSCAPLNIKYALSEFEKRIASVVRAATWFPLDEVWDVLRGINPKITRTSIYRCFVKEGINRVPQKEKEKAKKFKAYEPGYLHMDVTYLPKFNGKKSYLFVAIDRATRTLFYEIYQNKTAQNTEDFMDQCLEFFPFEITHILTDNGLEFTNRLLKSKKGEACQKPSKMDVKCEENGIEHRLTKPATPKTNGMVERANGIIKNGTILKQEYDDKKQMEQDLKKYLCYYNLYRRHGSLGKELNIRTPLEAVYKWFELDPDIFKIKPEEFENKLLDLQSQIKQLHQQPSET